MSLENKFRFIFIVGVVLLFASIFMDWFHFEAYNRNGKHIASWTYNIFTEWSTTKSGSENKSLRPSDLNLPIAMNIILLFFIFICLYSSLFRTIGEQEDLNQKTKGFSYANFILLFLNAFYLFVFPLFYLTPNNLYFPFLIRNNADANVTVYYYIGFGYALQVLAFLLIFPYTLFYYDIVQKFYSEEMAPKRVMEKYRNYIQEPIDFDKLISKEDIALKLEKSSLINSKDSMINKSTRRKGGKSRA